MSFEHSGSQHEPQIEVEVGPSLEPPRQVTPDDIEISARLIIQTLTRQ